jgi:hypothetical protein
MDPFMLAILEAVVTRLLLVVPLLRLVPRLFPHPVATHLLLLPRLFSTALPPMARCMA